MPRRPYRTDRRPRITYVFTASISVRFILDTLPDFLAAGFDISVIASPGEELDRAAALGATVYPVPMRRTPAPWHDLRAVVTLARLLRRTRPDLTNVGTPKAGLVGGLAAVIARVPRRVYTLHGLRLETLRGRARHVFHALEWISCRCSQEVLCVSPSLRSRVMALGLASPKHTVVLGAGTLLGIDLSPFTTALRAARQAVRQRFGIAPHELVIGFVGRLVRDKGVPELYKAFTLAAKQFPHARLLLVGSYEDADAVPPATRAAMEADEGVVHAGWQTDVTPFYAAMDLFALPSHREGLPTVLLEAQAAGLPVAACITTGVVDAVVDGTTAHLTPVGDVPALAHSLKSFLADASLREQFGRAGRAWVQANFSKEAQAQRLAAEYLRLLAS